MGGCCFQNGRDSKIVFPSRSLRLNRAMHLPRYLVLGPVPGGNRHGPTRKYKPARFQIALDIMS